MFGGNKKHENKLFISSGGFVCIFVAHLKQ